MNRRHLLHALHAIGACIDLPASEWFSGDSSVITQMAMPPAIREKAAADVTDTAWDIPKIGIVSVGGLGGTCLPSRGNLTQSLPYLNRTIAIETSSMELSLMVADRKVLVGDGKTVFNPHAAGLLAQSASHEIAEAVDGLDMVLLVAGMGGNTGTGITPIVAQMLRQKGVVTLGFAVMPFDYESPRRQKIAQAGIRDILPHVDALTPFFNNDIDQEVPIVRCLMTAMQQAPLAFDQLCRSIMNPVCQPSMVNIDFDDPRHTILRQKGDCAFGFGSASHVDGAEVAALYAIDHPFLGRKRLQLASAALVATSTSPQTTMLRDSKNVMNLVRKQLSHDANVIYGTTCEINQGEEITVSVLASGIRAT